MMKKIFYLSLALLLSSVCYGQEVADASQSLDEVYTVVDQSPEFPGGQKALFQFIAENTIFPDIDIALRHQGKAICQFVVERDGSLSNVQVVRSAGTESLDSAVVRMFRLMPRWSPGKQRVGDEWVAVRTLFTVPVVFKLPPVVVQPSYVGGASAQLAYVEKAMKYPKDAKKALIEGTVICQFMVAEDGSVKDAEVFASSGNESLDKEALRIVGAMPKWKPGTEDGKAVEMSAAMFVSFSLPADYVNKQVGVRVEESASVEGRNIVKLSVPACRKQTDGTIVYKALIDKEGKVISLLPGEGTDITDAEIVTSTYKAAMQTTFSAAENESVGNITYIFVSK